MIRCKMLRWEAALDFPGPGHETTGSLEKEAGESDSGREVGVT